MATARKKKVALSIEDRSTAAIFEDNYRDYGLMTIEDRALPDYRDGLLKVYRRTLWSMSHIAKANGDVVKTARVVGDVIGKYHPHGDLAVKAALESLVWSPAPLVHKDGNWGSQFDNAAAMRYTNCRMSEFGGKLFFQPEYMAVSKFHPNYDAKDEEPELLPALLPNVLLNGVVLGVAVGLRVTMPSFEQKGVVALLKGMLQGKKLTPAICKKHLVFKFAFGGNIPIEGDNEDALDSLIKDGEGSFYVYCDYVLDKKARTLTITGIPPRKPIETLIANLRDTEYFTSVHDASGKDSKTPADLVCTFKKTVSIDKVMEDIEEDCLWSKVTFNMAVIKRQWKDDENRIRSTVHQWGIVELLENWLKWRLELEAKMLKARVAARKAEIDKRNLLLLAQKNRKLIADSWEAPDQKAFVASKLKISAEDAAYVCDLRVSQLAKLSREKLLKEIESIQALIKQDQGYQKDISGSVLRSLAALEI